ncbi:MAG: FadR/GntR family transcriptional regulator, partial [Clostridia bacterium]
ITGTFKSGDKLPSENAICKEYGVSRVSVRAALHELLALGLIETSFGRGSYVKKVKSGDAMNGLIPTAYINDKSIVELVEFRQVIEGEVCFLACKKAKNSDVEKLEALYREMQKNTEYVHEFAKYDSMFHSKIAKMSRNSYVIKVYEIVQDVLRTVIDDILTKRGIEVGLYYHRRILDAIIARDAVQAKEIMNEHTANLLKESFYLNGESMEERLNILYAGNVIDEETQKFGLETVKYLMIYGIKVSQMETFVTHLVMATMRIKSGQLASCDVNKMKNDIIAEVGEETFLESLKMYGEIIKNSPVKFCDEEKMFVLLHLNTLLFNK